jgi:hypothetical protein
MQDEYVEVFEVKEGRPIEIKVKNKRWVGFVHEEADDTELGDFEKRMANWRRVVCGSVSRGGDGFCAGWARLYVQTRDERERRKMLKRYGPGMALLLMPTMTSSTRISIDELDGWLVEAAVRSLPDFNERKVLQMWHVWQYPEHWIKSKLLLRRGVFRLILGRAQRNLKNALRNINCAANIQSNNLHAGTDPRLESKDVP